MTSNLIAIDTKWARVSLLFLLLCSTASFAGTESWEDRSIAADITSERGSYREAENHMEVALKEAEQAGRPDPNSAASLTNLAEAYADQGNFHEAEALFMRALVIMKSAPDTDDSEITEHLKKLADYYRAKAVYLRNLRTVDGD